MDQENEYSDPNYHHEKEQENTMRDISTIAREIRKDWIKPAFGAVPYLDALLQLEKVTDYYYQDSAKSIIRYFLANAPNWRGEAATRIKKELRDMLGK